MKLYVEKREIRSGGVLRDAFYVVDETGKTMSPPFPTRHLAKIDRQKLVDDLSDYEIGTGRRRAA